MNSDEFQIFTIFDRNAHKNIFKEKTIILAEGMLHQFFL